MRSSTTRVVLGLLVGLALLAAGCSGSSNDPAPPPPTAPPATAAPAEPTAPPSTAGTDQTQPPGTVDSAKEVRICVQQVGFEVGRLTGTVIATQNPVLSTNAAAKQVVVDAKAKLHPKDFAIFAAVGDYMLDFYKKNGVRASSDAAKAAGDYDALGAQVADGCQKAWGGTG